jgi:hypothetical protein
MLTDTERAVLDFEGLRWKYGGARDAAILERFGWSPTRHAQVVVSLLDRPDALAYAPATVRRLARLRDARRVARAR